MRSTFSAVCGFDGVGGERRTVWLVIAFCGKCLSRIASC